MTSAAVGSHSAETGLGRPLVLGVAVTTTVVAAVLFLLGMVVELVLDGRATIVGWPVVWAASMSFFAVMTWQGRYWGGCMLVVQSGLTWVLAGELIVTTPSILDAIARPDEVVRLTLAAAIVQTIGALTVLLPPAGRYRRATAVKLMGRRLRRAVLAVHVISSLAWFGIITVQSVLAGVARTVGADRALLRALYEAQYLIDNLFLGKTSFVVLFSGLALGLGTQWGLVRHRWLVAKLVLTLTVMVLPLAVYHPVLDRGYALVLEQRTAEEVNQGLGLTGLLPALGLSPLMLLAAALLSLYKPKGRTSRRSR